MDKKDIVAFIKSQEGGFANVPGDKGKETNKGITIGTFRQVFGQNKTVMDLKRITDEQWMTVFDRLFWKPCMGDEIEDGRVSGMMVDWAFNSGVKTAVKWAQATCNAVLPKGVSAVNSLGRRVESEQLLVDGVMGRKTLAALNKVDVDRFVSVYADMRRKYYLRLGGFSTDSATMALARTRPSGISLQKSVSSQKKFVRGWLNRVNAIEKLMVNG